MLCPTIAQLSGLVAAIDVTCTPSGCSSAGPTGRASDSTAGAVRLLWKVSVRKRTTCGMKLSAPTKRLRSSTIEIAAAPRRRRGASNASTDGGASGSTSMQHAAAAVEEALQRVGLAGQQVVRRPGQHHHRACRRHAVARQGAERLHGEALALERLAELAVSGALVGILRDRARRGR